MTGWFSGAPFSFQSGISSSSARGSMIAPDRMCAPGSEPFSRTTTEISCERSAASCFRRIAVASPAGPAPTMATSYSIASRGPCWARISSGVIAVSLFLSAGRASKLSVDSTERNRCTIHELSDRSVGARRPRHRRIGRPRRAVRARPGQGGRRRRARRAPRREAEEPARRDRGRGRRCPRRGARRHRPRQHPLGRRAYRDRDGNDRHPGQQLRRGDDPAADRGRAGRLRLRLRRQRARRVLRGAGSRQADDRARARARRRARSPAGASSTSPRWPGSG